MKDQSYLKIPISCREQFCNDFKIPIKIFSSPLFEYYCELFNEDFQVSSRAALFLKVLEENENDLKKFKDYWHKIKHQIITDISATPEYQSSMAEKWTYQSPFKVERGNPYNHAFTNVECISIDITSANFQSLRYMNPNIVFGTKTFAELLSRYTAQSYFAQVKIFRQIIFESLGANRQQAVQRKMMDTVLKSLFDLKPDLFVRMPSNDEIIVPLNQGSSALGDDVESLVKNHDLGSILKVERFVVKHIEDDMFYKLFSDGKFILRNVGGQHFARAYKKVKGLPTKDEDLYFMFEGKLAKFVRTDDK